MSGLGQMQKDVSVQLSLKEGHVKCLLHPETEFLHWQWCTELTFHAVTMVIIKVLNKTSPEVCIFICVAQFYSLTPWPCCS